MKKKGFTLIELLAVIIVLAIIALIAMPIIFNVIENAKLKALENSAYGVVDAVRLYYMENLMNTDNGEVPTTGSVTTLSLSGEHPTGGTWIIVSDANSEDGIGIKIEGVTFASMQGYVCESEEDASGNLTGKVVCVKDNLVFTIDEELFENGWAKNDINVKVTADGASNLKYCLSTTECTPNQDVPSSGINITTEGTTHLCVKGNNTRFRCNIYNLDKTTPTLTAKENNITIEPGENIDINSYLNTPTYGPSNGNVVCKDETNNEITNTSGLSLGTHMVTCNAISNSGLSSSDVILTITVEEPPKFARLQVDVNGNGEADLGDEVCIQNDCFNVLTNDGTNIRMLAKKRLEVSSNTTRKERLQSDRGTLNTEFASTTVHGINYNSYEGSIAEGLVGDYKRGLEGLGATIIDATLLSYEEITSEPFNCSVASNSCNPNYSWLYKVGNANVEFMWTKSAYPGSTTVVWTIYAEGYLYMRAEYNTSYPQTIRPVITIPTSAI